jgi:C_GCAxxG_C_C family probable redox protein
MHTREELIQKAYDLAYKYEAERGSCPQCVLAAIYETFGIGKPESIKAIDGLAGGTALSAQGTCGALVGGIAALSSIIGRTYSDFSKGGGNRRIFVYANMLYEKFVAEYGSILCKDVHQKLFNRTFDLRNAQDYQEFEDMGAHVDKCPVVSGRVAAWTAEILIDKLKITKPSND